MEHDHPADSAARHDVLSRYLHGHLIAGASGERLFEQAAKTWKDSPHAATLDKLKSAVSSDKKTLEAMATQLHLSMPAYKKPIAWVGAQLSALGPLNPFHSHHAANAQLELEALIIAVTGKALLWKTLIVLAPTDSRIRRDEVNQLLDRAMEQIHELETLLLTTVPDRFTAPVP
ncbi:hypothetical protein [Pseudarthrobacter sp. S9]|uniref:hypothetical protein n=1 Tax=Pseudarthrobacter sp. S9 TaxID=3418421 RepID=UPI003D040246